MTLLCSPRSAIHNKTGEGKRYSTPPRKAPRPSIRCVERLVETYSIGRSSDGHHSASGHPYAETEMARMKITNGRKN